MDPLFPLDYMSRQPVIETSSVLNMAFYDHLTFTFHYDNESPSNWYEGREQEPDLDWNEVCAVRCYIPEK